MGIFGNKKLEAECDALRREVSSLKAQMASIGITEYQQAAQKLEEIKRDTSIQIQKYNDKMIELQDRENSIRASIDSLIKEMAKKNDEYQELDFKLSSREAKYNSQIANSSKKLARIKELYKSIEYYVNRYYNPYSEPLDYIASSAIIGEVEDLAPSVTIKLHSMDVKELRKAYKENEKIIDSVLDQYSARYTTKGNKAIYSLMVVALRAEMQNILYTLKFNKLDNAIEDVKKVTQKYIKIAAEGNQSIAGILQKFIAQIEYLFINSVKIEYNYYVKKEQARQEQLAIREQMRQEAEERKALEQERKRVEQEEEKYKQEIGKLQETLNNTESDDEIAKLKARILELQGQLSDIVIKREEIANLQNGKAGNVYIISNLGSFGNDVFKIGMTRRLDPQDRVNELGSASVPFKFDVHSFIFSEDAVSLENELHKRLNSKRLNKVNLRKEFFKVSLDDLEQLVQDIEPTAEFNRTMAAEEYYQSMSTDDVYTSDYQYEYAGIDEEDEE